MVATGVRRKAKAPVAELVVLAMRVKVVSPAFWR